MGSQEMKAQLQAVLAEEARTKCEELQVVVNRMTERRFETYIYESQYSSVPTAWLYVKLPSGEQIMIYDERALENMIEFARVMNTPSEDDMEKMSDLYK